MSSGASSFRFIGRFFVNRWWHHCWVSQNQLRYWFEKRLRQNHLNHSIVHIMGGHTTHILWWIPIEPKFEWKMCLPEQFHWSDQNTFLGVVGSPCENRYNGQSNACVFLAITYMTNEALHYAVTPKPSDYIGQFSRSLRWGCLLKSWTKYCCLINISFHFFFRSHCT